ncbi:MAG: TetR/AcrR family transcriptional regulator [Burkholderiaceae bacterium]|jgi:AcrR family transcriptional regulator|nr:MAG: TetR/AcrR family transcriptional regulator [Burkholderiaceae bacterium]
MKPKPSRPDHAERRRPRQSRSNQTARALREAFVQLLVERGYAAITVREITGVAGTALGSFYDYFAGKEDLARVSLHLRSKMLVQTLRGVTTRHRGESLVDMASAIVDALLAMHREHPEEWAAHYLLERRFSGLDAYRKMYARFVDAWTEAITATRDWPVGQPARDAAGVCQALLYGLVTHAYLTRSNAPSRPDANILRRQVITAIAAYLQVARDEAARH